ncbi:hypothetical protein BGZ80_010197 [Entomortierella chlamydospora]|uniref:Uncharacterized protein n=1 Tax=Entomortierella chlamydospora TaxID=101097 RepID=A0A9P6MV62_9FUNG|nr:hypothetical protein BGZ79_009239 [Entomortierella chlamydospora]KAG0014831.1 hypothetical protein BGZ80_010197 [Entomortierella chlamydospora]
MAPAASDQLQRIDAVAPSLMQPSQSLGSRTPMQLVNISNIKLNAQIFSSRSLSIQRRILIKNFLAALYQLHPIEWIEESPADDKDHWMEQTLSAAGIEHQDVSAQGQECGNGYDYYGQDYDSYSSLGQMDESELSPAAAAAASAATLRRRLRSLRSSSMPLPRPASMELPVALQSYLSTVFDVDWSVGLANKEDYLFTSRSAQHSPKASLAPSALSSNSSLGSLSTPASSPTSSSVSHATSISSIYGKKEYDESDCGVSAFDFPPVPQTHSYGNCVPTPVDTNARGNSHLHGKQPQLGMESFSSTNSNAHDSNHSYYSSNSQPHIHSHIHVRNYPSDSLQNSILNSSNGERGHVAPRVRSSRYPKSEPLLRETGTLSYSHTHAPLGAHSEPHSYSLEFPAPPSKLPLSAPATTTVVGPLASSPSPTSSSPGVYPPEKTGYLTDGQENQPYLATAPSVSSRYTRSPPPPPYTQSPEDISSSMYESPPYHRATKSDPIFPLDTSVVTTRPQSQSSLADAFSKASNNANQKLIEYQRYQELQRMFVRDDEGKNDARTSDGVGFIRQLFKSNSKKKTAGFVISAPLPSSATSSPLLISSHTPCLLQDLTSQELVNQLPSRGSRSSIMN